MHNIYDEPLPICKFSLSSEPAGYLDSVSDEIENYLLLGWSIITSDKTCIIPPKILIALDNFIIGECSIFSEHRPDVVGCLNQIYENINDSFVQCGFSFQIPKSLIKADDLHLITLFAQDDSMVIYQLAGSGKIDSCNLVRGTELDIQKIIDLKHPVGYIDNIDEENGNFIIKGWAKYCEDEKDILTRRIFIAEGYNVIGIGYCSLPRYDIIKESIYPFPLNCGFDIKIPKSVLSKNGYGFSVYAETKTGQLVSLSDCWGGFLPLGQKPVNTDEPKGLIDAGRLIKVQLELTSKCNLRCVYCAVSQPNYVGRDLSSTVVQHLIDEFEKARLPVISVNGHGETTIYNDWVDTCHKLINKQFDLTIISNFAKEFSQEEIEVLSKFSQIYISFDIFDRKKQQSICRGLDIRNILYNMTKIRVCSHTNGYSEPEFQWKCVVSDKVVFDLPELARAAISMRVSSFFFGDLEKYSDVPGEFNVYPIISMEKHKLEEAIRCIAEAAKYLRENKCKVYMHDGLHSLIQSREVSVLQSKGKEHYNESIGREIIYSDVSLGETRDCLDPWSFTLIESNGRVRPCCFSMSVGQLYDGTEFNSIINNERIKELRKNLLTGNLDKYCKTCGNRGTISTALLQAKVHDFLSRPHLSWLNKYAHSDVSFNQ